MTHLTTTHGPDGDAIAAFRALVLSHYRASARDDLPWRMTEDPWRVLVSEVMLQQTQVPRVLPKYVEWFETFPDARAVAAAPLSLVLERWQGLGYNRRAMALKRAAGIIVERWHGEVPADPASLVLLPGIGPATAAAILNYAWDIPAPFMETNVRAVHLHHFFADATDVPDRVLMPIVEAAWDRQHPRRWGWALMDYGTHLKKTLPNPSRRSRHHARQSPFEGSRRQRRARLLRAVMADPGMDADRYAEVVSTDPRDAEEILSQLEQEGFVRRSGERWDVSD